MESSDFREEFLHCPVCMEEFVNPKTLLPCQHTICQECLQNYITKTTLVEKPNYHWPGIKCPICKQDVPVKHANRTPRHAWAKHFPNNFVFKSMISSLKQAQSKGVDQNKCSLHTKSLSTYCQTHSTMICDDCCYGEHESCQLTTNQEMIKELSSNLTEIENLNEYLKEASKQFYEAIEISNVQNAMQEIIQNLYSQENHMLKHQVQISQKKMKEKAMEMLDSEHKAMQSKLDRCISAIEDAESCLAQSTSNMTASKVCTISGIAREMINRLKHQQKAIRMAPQMELLMKMNIKSLLTPVKEGQTSTFEFEKMAIPFSLNLGFSKVNSFNAKLESDRDNCYITGITVMVNGRIVLADQNNCKLKIFSENFHFLGEFHLLAPPFDITETEPYKLAVTFGKKNIIHLYDVQDIRKHCYQSFSTGQPCYGITSGSGLVLTYCDSKLSASVKVYDYGMKLVYQIPLGRLVTADYLDYCPVSGKLYITTQRLHYRYLTCFNEGKAMWSETIDNAVPKGLVAIPNGVLVAHRPRLQPFTGKKPSILWKSECGSCNRTVLDFSEVGYARVIASNKARSVLVVTREVPFVSLAENNDVLVYRIEK